MGHVTHFTFPQLQLENIVTLRLMSWRGCFILKEIRELSNSGKFQTQVLGMQYRGDHRVLINFIFPFLELSILVRLSWLAADQ